MPEERKNITVERFQTLRSKKSTKISYMKSVQRFLDPNDGHLTRSDLSSEADIIWDTTARNLLEDHTFRSLSDIINPFEPWFTLHIRKNKDVDEKVLLDWAKRNTELLFNFIGSTSYYPSIIQDKINFDSYGFSGMSFLEREGQLKIGVEDPFNLILNDDAYQDKVMEIYWVIKEDLFSLRKKYNIAANILDTLNPENNKTKYNILCCLIPNDPIYVNDADMERSEKFVFVRFFLGADKEGANLSSREIFAGTAGEEIGERVYFDKPFIVTPRDRKKIENPYGVGLGKRLLVEAQNLNQIRRDVLNASATYGDPAKVVPYDIWVKLESGEVSLRRGSTIPASSTGEQVQPIVQQINYQAQVGLLQYEDFKIQNSVPQQTAPQKNARQSQFEVDLNTSQTAQLQLIYKMIYLHTAVSEHLKLLFDFAMKTGVLEKLPEGLKKSDVEPTLSNILLKEFKKAKAQAYLQTISQLNPYISINPELMDNFDPDVVARNTALAYGAGDMILDSQDTEAIRQNREQIQAEQEQAEIGLRQEEVASQSGLNSAQANKATLEAQILQQKLEEGG